MNRLALTLATVATLTGALHAQAPASTTIAPPLLPLMTSYRYWPVQFVQFVGAELPYAMIELDVDPNGKHPLLHVVLTDRATGKRVHYAETDALLASATALGEETHKATLAFEPADTDTTGSISTLRFTMADGKPLQWRFVQGSDISEQGSGLTPLADSNIPIFAYREQAAVAGEGTALQVGDTVSTASVWTEISQPPYFVAYRGAESDSAHTLVFLPGQETWTVASAPSALTAGATWELDEAKGNHRSIHIDKVDGTHITATATDRFAPGVYCRLEANRTGDTWAITGVRFAPVKDGEKHFLALNFATPLTAAAENTKFTLQAGKKPIANGSLAASADHSETLSFSNPAWLNGKTLVTQASVNGKEISLVAHP